MGNKARRRERETERERNLRRRGRGGEQHSGERKRCGLILTVGINHQLTNYRSTPENLLMATIDGLAVNQTFGW